MTTKEKKIKMLKQLLSGKGKLNPLVNNWKERLPMLKKSNKAELSALVANPFMTHLEAVGQMSESLLQNMIEVLEKRIDYNELTDAEKKKLSFYEHIIK